VLGGRATALAPGPSGRAIESVARLGDVLRRTDDPWRGRLFGRTVNIVTSTGENGLGVELQTDGKIVVAGSAAHGGGSDGKFVVARYDAT
jgi:hypothetical protein